MKKLTKKSLDELARVMPVISENEQKSLIGASGNIESSGFGVESGVSSTHYSWEEYKIMSSNGTWQGGYVDGHGYIKGGSYVNKNDINEEIAENWNPITGILEQIFNYNDITQNVIDVNNQLQYNMIKDYLSKNDSIYKVTTTYVSNLGKKIEKDTYYDKNKNVVAEIIRR